MAFSSKVDVNYLPTNKNIRWTDKPVVQKLPPASVCMREKEPIQSAEKEVNTVCEGVPLDAERGDFHQSEKPISGPISKKKPALTKPKPPP